MSHVKEKKFIAKSLRDFLIGLPRPAKQIVSIGTDAIGFAVSCLAVSWLLFGGSIATAQIVRICVATIVIAVLLAWIQGLYRSVVRYMGLDLFIAGSITAAGSSLVGATLLYFAEIQGAPVRWIVAFWAMAFIYICGSRYFARIFLVRQSTRKELERVIVYGAGAAGARLTISLLSSDEFLPVAMVDDDPTLHGKKVKGLEVHGPAMIEALIRDTNAKRVLLAMPGASRRKRRQVLERLSEFPVHVQTMPEIKDIISGKARVDDISDVQVTDLLGRDPVPPNSKLLGASITGKNVMVTGAGGSIGSELCRQILKLNPSRLLLLELGESALYNVNKELERISAKIDSDCEIVALLGSVHHEERIRDVMKNFRIHTVYHAAAYKHVPIVEQNLFEGIHNNIFGTLYTARAAIDTNVETFVLVSTDKAVSPSSVMGATKRFAELILQAYNCLGRDTRFCMVRFGNVLESSGSVVPLFREQIRNGGPVTVTHRDIIRYFMTIPEAAQLVIQAGSMARGGDVFVLDMGKPVKILDLACRMINLMGLSIRDDSNPDGDIDIQFIGLRPAEKLYEELLIGSNVSGTEHPRIMRADEDFVPYNQLSGLVRDLKEASQNLDYDRSREILLQVVNEYSPTNGIEDLLWVSMNRSKDHKDTDTIVDFPTKHA